MPRYAFRLSSNPNWIAALAGLFLFILGIKFYRGRKEGFTIGIWIITPTVMVLGKKNLSFFKSKSPRYNSVVYISPNASLVYATLCMIVAFISFALIFIELVSI